MSIFSKKNKTITITPNFKYCIWNVSTDGIAVDTQVIVNTGCTATYVVNGQYRNTYEAGNKVLINEKWERKTISTLALVAANSDKVFEICCGVGEVPFRDRELEVDTLVGANADMKVRIRDPWELYKEQGNRNLSEEEINGILRAKLAEILRGELAKKLLCNTYFSITAQTKKMSDELAEQMKKVIFDRGLYMMPNSFALSNLHFDNDYLELRKRAGISHVGNKIAEEEITTIRKRSRAELEIFNAIGEAAKSKDEQSANNKCPKCGAEVKSGTNFCPNCAAKI